MKTSLACGLCLLLLLALPGQAQNETRGFEMPMTLSGAGFASHRLSESQDSDSNATGALRVMAYPTLRINENWFFSGAVQIHSRPYFFEQFESADRGFQVDALQAYVGYERLWGERYVTVRAGQLSSAFGSFLLRYDDAVNPLVDLPISYGYYYGSPVTTLGLSGVQVDVGSGRFDARAQFTSSSPVNRRGIRDDSHYGSWAGGLGYTPVQGLRVGASAYRGPYIDEHERIEHGEIHPKLLPATGVGLDVQFSRGHWYFNGEVNRFIKAYTVEPTSTKWMTWGEVKRVLHPRWYVAGRVNYDRSNRRRRRKAYEFAIGYRQARNRLIKVGYQAVHGARTRGALDNVLAVQLVVKIAGISKTFE
jgi:hypothetical protein